MRRVLLTCCEKTWCLDLDYDLAVGHRIKLKGYDKEENKDIEFHASITKIHVDPYARTQVVVFVAPSLDYGLTYEYIKANITPEDATHD